VDEMMDKPTNTMDLVSYGLTKREYFAAAALQGMLSHGNEKQYFVTEKIPTETVRLADLILAELEKEEQNAMD